MPNNGTAADETSYDYYEMDADFFKEYEAEMAKRTGAGPWRIALFGVDPQGDTIVWRGGDDQRRSIHEDVARVSLSYHAPSIGDIAELAREADPADTLCELRSVYAVPVFDPEVFQPDPSHRPLLGIVTFASPFTDAELVGKRVEVQTIADGVANEIIRAPLTRS